MNLKKSIVLVPVSILLLSAFTFSGCSSDGDEPEPEIVLETAPVIKPATNVVAASFTANWEEVTGAKFYKLDVSTNAEFTAMVSGFDGKEVTGASTEVTGLSGSSKYFYRVRAGNGLGETENSKVARVREINKTLLINKLWKGDEVKSGLTGIFFQDLYFDSDGSYQGYFGGNLLTEGDWEWINDDTVEVTLSGTTFTIKFLDITATTYVAYFSVITAELAFFNT